MDLEEPGASSRSGPTPGEAPASPKATSSSPGRRRPQPRHASAPGVGLAFDVASSALSAQMANVDGLNTRLGGVLAGALVLAGISVVAKDTVPLRAVATLVLVLAVTLSAWASRTSKWSSAPDPEWLAKFSGDEPDFMKEVALPGVLRSLERNRAQLEGKGQLLNWAAVCLAGAGALLLVGRILAG